MISPNRPADSSASESVHTAVPKTVSFGTLAEGCKEVIIEHDGLEYRLRMTRNGRLILNK
ncbi:MAG: hemin uptake protein HemP [Fuerstiella sp.]